MMTHDLLGVVAAFSPCRVAREALGFDMDQCMIFKIPPLPLVRHETTNARLTERWKNMNFYYFRESALAYAELFGYNFNENLVMEICVGQDYYRVSIIVNGAMRSSTNGCRFTGRPVSSRLMRKLDRAFE